MSFPDHCKTLLLEEGHNELKVSRFKTLTFVYKYYLICNESEMEQRKYCKASCDIRIGIVADTAMLVAITASLDRRLAIIFHAKLFC